MSRKVCCQLQIGIHCQSIGGLQNDMTSRALLGMKPEVTTSGLTKADPVVLTVVTSHLQLQSSRPREFKRMRCRKMPLSSRLTTFSWIQKFLQFATHVIQGVQSRSDLLPG